MKKILILATIGMLYISCTNHNYNNINDYNLLALKNLKGNVICIKDTTFYAYEKFGEPVLGRISKITEYNFNADGNVVKYTEYDENGEIRNRSNYTYENGKITQRIKYRSDGRISFTEKHEYQENTEIVQSINYDYGGNIFSKRYIRNENGEFIESFYQSKDDFVPKIEKLIHKKENVSKWEILEGNKKVIKEKIYSISKKYEHEITKEDGVITWDWQGWFDENHNLIEIKCGYNKDSVAYWNKYKYDKNNNLIKEETLKDDLAINEDETKETITTYSYKYDKKGNWIEKNEYKNGKIQKIIKRYIQY